MVDFSRYLDLNVETGELIWKHRDDISPSNNKKHFGKVAGHVRSQDGYIRLALNGKEYLAHRVAWALVHGHMPTQELDHVNGDRTDNRPENLRLSDRSKQMRNSRARGKWPKGVCLHPNGKFQAQIGAKGVKKNLGYYATPEEAHAAYATAAKEHFGEFACLTR